MWYWSGGCRAPAHSSQQHNAAEQASTAHSQKRFLLSRTRRPLSLSFPEKMRCWCWRRHYGKMLFKSVKDWLWNFVPFPFLLFLSVCFFFFLRKKNIRIEYIFNSKRMHQKFAAMSVEKFLFNIHSVCKYTDCFLLESALKYAEEKSLYKMWGLKVWCWFGFCKCLKMFC